MATLFCEASARLRPSTHIATAGRSPAASHLSGACRHFSTTPARNARLIRRPVRPYTFTQIVQLSDGSTYAHRTMSPFPLHKSTKDSRNHTIWQPSDKSLQNLEVDEAGRLATFRSRFGNSWDATDVPEEEPEPEPVRGKKGRMTSRAAAIEAAKKAAKEEAALAQPEDSVDTLADLLSGYAAKVEQPASGGLIAKDQAKLDKKKKK